MIMIELLNVEFVEREKFYERGEGVLRVIYKSDCESGEGRSAMQRACEYLEEQGSPSIRPVTSDFMPITCKRPIPDGNEYETCFKAEIYSKRKG